MKIYKDIEFILYKCLDLIRTKFQKTIKDYKNEIKTFSTQNSLYKN